MTLWWDLVALGEEIRQAREDTRAQGWTSCPNDGTPLVTGHDGVLYCKFDGWRADVAVTEPAWR
jgi:hypothetical protein